jgi:hypothetical protein
MARSLMKGVKVEKPLLRVPAKIGQIASDGRRSVRSTIHLGQSPASDQRMIACASNHLSGERMGGVVYRKNGHSGEFTIQGLPGVEKPGERLWAGPGVEDTGMIHSRPTCQYE